MLELEKVKVLKLSELVSDLGGPTPFEGAAGSNLADLCALASQA